MCKAEEVASVAPGASWSAAGAPSLQAVLLSGAGDPEPHPGPLKALTRSQGPDMLSRPQGLGSHPRTSGEPWAGQGAGRGADRKPLGCHGREVSRAAVLKSTPTSLWTEKHAFLTFRIF